MQDNRFGYGQIAEIRYSDEYARILKCFEHVVQSEDFSESSLNVTTCAIRLNPVNYNFWIFRRKILKNIKYDPFKELCWTEEILSENPKNFHCWDHRRCISNWNLSCCSATHELNLTKRLLTIDAKNYHAWSHRQWAINTFKFTNLGLMTDEMRFTSAMINEDIRNNSAWNQRFFVMTRRGKTDPVLVQKEFKYALEKIKVANGNESAWNYMRGLLLTFGNNKLYQFKELTDYCEEEFYEKGNKSQHLVGFFIDCKIEIILDFYEPNEFVQTQKVFELCNAMAFKYDKIRKNYWKFVYKQFYYDKVMKRREKDQQDNCGSAHDETWKAKVGKKANEDIFSFQAHNATCPRNNKNQSKVKKRDKEKAMHIGNDLMREIIDKYQ